MTCQELAQRLSELNPGLSQADVARLALLILCQSPDPDDLYDDQVLDARWRNATFRLESASDQHDAVADELEAMCESDEVGFTHNQVAVLLRAVKVQSQILELYTDQPQPV